MKMWKDANNDPNSFCWNLYDYFHFSKMLHGWNFYKTTTCLNRNCSDWKMLFLPYSGLTSNVLMICNCTDWNNNGGDGAPNNLHNIRRNNHPSNPGRNSSMTDRTKDCSNRRRSHPSPNHYHTAGGADDSAHP